MADEKLIPAQAPNGETIVLKVVDLDGSTTADTGDRKVSSGLAKVSDALSGVDDFANSLRAALKRAAPDKTTVEFTIGFAVQAGKLTAMFVDGKVDGSVTVTLEWGSGE